MNESLAVIVLILSFVLYFIFCSGTIWFGTREGVRNGKLQSWGLCLIASVFIVAIVKYFFMKILSALFAAIIGLIKIIVIIILAIVILGAAYVAFCLIKQMILRTKKGESFKEDGNPVIEDSYLDKNETKKICVNCGYEITVGQFCPECGAKYEVQDKHKEKTDYSEVHDNTQEKRKDFYESLSKMQLILFTILTIAVIVGSIWLLRGALNIGKKNVDDSSSNITEESNTNSEENNSYSENFEDQTYSDSMKDFNDNYSSLDLGDDSDTDSNLIGKPLIKEFNSQSGYSVMIPEIYDDEVVIRDGILGTSFSAIQCEDNGDGGVLFYIGRVSYEDMENVTYDRTDILYQEGDSYYVMGTPTDVEYSERNAEIYNALISYYDDIKDSFSYTGFDYDVDILYEVIADAPDGYVNVRTDTTTDSMVIYEAGNGNLFSVTGEYGDWLEVALQPTGTNPFGYIHSSQVTRLSKTPNSNFIIEGSDSGYFGEAFLEGFSAWDCRLARNEIYARHGKIFKDEALQTYFNSFSGIWYTPEYEDVPDSMLNQWEIENVKTIIGYEEKMGYR